MDEPGTDALVSRLLAAWRGGPLLDPSDDVWNGLDQVAAAEVGRRVLEQLGTGDESPFWKLGATDEQTQARLGVQAAVCAPLVAQRVQHGLTEYVVDRRSFCQPRLEAEIGLVASGGGWIAVPAVEFADCRVEGWQLPAGGLLADACLQGSMIFGVGRAADPPHDEVEVVVRLDGNDVARGAGHISAARGRLRVLPDGCAAAFVATGSLTSLLDVVPGTWDFDFGGLGRLVIDVV